MDVPNPRKGLKAVKLVFIGISNHWDGGHARVRLVRPIAQCLGMYSFSPFHLLHRFAMLDRAAPGDLPTRSSKRSCFTGLTGLPILASLRDARSVELSGSL